MNSDSLTRAIAAACITIALLGSGMLFARGAFGANPAQALHPDKYLPVVMRDHEPTTSPTTTTTTTATASPTTTATPTVTMMPTAIPTSDPLATAQLLLTNHTGFPLSFVLDGPTTASDDVAPNTTFLLSIRPGDYVIKGFTHCQSSTFPFSIAAQESKPITYICP